MASSGSVLARSKGGWSTPTACPGYGQFCPVAKASEILAERWTPLVLRELMCGSRHFNELRPGVQLMSPALLSKRLRTLEDGGCFRATGERA